MELGESSGYQPGDDTGKDDDDDDNEEEEEEEEDVDEEGTERENEDKPFRCDVAECGLVMICF